MASDERIGLITGANAGIGKELVRQLALSGRYRKIYLACRNRTKAARARAELQAATGKTMFEIVSFDVSDLASAAAIVSALEEPIDDIVMNAGGSGGRTPLASTEAGVTEIFASNVLGHVALLDGLLAAGRLRRAAVFVGSEAARGVPKLGMRRPKIVSGSVEEFVAFCDGSFFKDRKADGVLAYGQVKLVAALWMASMARRHPSLRFIVMSPGNTAGTDIARDLPLPIRLLMRSLLVPVVLPLLGLIHPVATGAGRLVRALEDPDLTSGAFYASRVEALTGPVADQSTFMPEIAIRSFQDNASVAVHRFL